MLTKPLLVLLVPLALLAAACGDDDDDVNTGTSDTTDTTQAPGGGEVPDRAIDLTGTITVITPFVPITEDCVPADELDPDDSVSSDDPPVCTPEDNDVLGTILVEGDLAPEQGRKISFTVTTDSVITGEGVTSFADLEEGQLADTWTTGACAESYPEQCGLEAIRVTG